jgi:hypothetical protein
MSKLVFFANETGGVAMCRPDLKEISAYQCGRKIAPKGQPFVIVNEEDVPFDNINYFDAWEVDLSNPDGFGIGIEEWYKEFSEDPTIAEPDLSLMNNTEV